MDFYWINAKKPALILAPMEGMMDAPMRTLMTERGGFSFCVSEFLRISQEIPPARTFYEHVPEFWTGCKTASGTPVQIQLLGGNEEKLALSASRACELGASAIDLNFGCPSPVVNRHDGGASLLRYPQRIQSLVSAVRKAVPSQIPVSAKLRLGWDSMSDIFINAEQAALGGASWLTIHARTKVQGYIPPAHWKYIGEVRRNLDIPIVANGDIWTRDDFLRCWDETGCQHFMLGRGALANPMLVKEIARHLDIEVTEDAEVSPFLHSPENWEPLLRRFTELTEPRSKKENYSVCRIKQWLKLVHTRNSLHPWFDEIKRCHSLNDLFFILKQAQTKSENLP